MHMKRIDVQRYLDEAVNFSARPTPLGRGKPLRVASTLVTCGMAAGLLNELGVPPESAAYSYVNVHNPRCPLFFDAEQGWASLPAYEHHPVWGVNWAAARLMCQHLGGRLPLQQEWECFAANNDPTRKYPWGNATPTHLLANFGEHVGGTSTVCSFPPTELGLYDLAGNLSEWCHDLYEAPGSQGTSCERVVKGGAWSKDAHYLEITTSRGKWERLGTTTIGFRPVWDD